jgi:hypothetical protein
MSDLAARIFGMKSDVGIGFLLLNMVAIVWYCTLTGRELQGNVVMLVLGIFTGKTFHGIFSGKIIGGKK